MNKRDRYNILILASALFFMGLDMLYILSTEKSSREYSNFVFLAITTIATIVLFYLTKKKWEK